MSLLGRVGTIGLNGKLISNLCKVGTVKVAVLGSLNKMVLKRTISCGIVSIKTKNGNSGVKPKFEAANVGSRGSQALSELFPQVSSVGSRVQDFQQRTFSSMPSRHAFDNYSDSSINALHVSQVHQPEVKIEVLPKHVAVKSNSVSLNLTGPRTAEWFTGPAPAFGMCPGVEADGKLYSLPQLTFADGKCTRAQLQAYFDNTWTLTEVLLSSLQGEEAFTAPPYHDLRHPMIFYYGHPAALYVNKLRVAGLLSAPINPYFEVIFETGVDEMSWDDLSKNKMPWPSVNEVHAYRQEVYAKVSEVISGLTDAQCASIGKDSALWALVMAFEHERIHLETSSVLISELPLKYVQFPVGFPAYHQSVLSTESVTDIPVAGTHYPINKLISVDSQKVSLGKPSDFPSFGWDNEYGHREYSLSPFKASQYKVTNGEYLEFVRDGGYSKTEYWSEAGWEWRAFRNAKWPAFWTRRGPQGVHQYDLRLLFDSAPMQWSWPVSVNLHEASAFAKWKAIKTNKPMRVITELEHRAIRGGDVKALNTVEGEHVARLSGFDMKSQGINTNLAYSSMSPVTSQPPNALGFSDVFGNAWEWTVDKFCALPGFEVHPTYEDFSTPCFDGLHNVIQGGSFISTGNESSVHSRFHFRPHFHQHASFRLVEQEESLLMTSDTDAPGPYVGSYPFRRSAGAMVGLLDKTNEKKTARNSVLSKHFGSAVAFTSTVSGGASQLSPLHGMSEVVRRHTEKLNIASTANVIEVGCGPGGLVFDLARTFHSVIGVEHSGEAVDTARRLLDGQTIEYTLRGEGEQFETVQTSLLTEKNSTEKSLFPGKKVEFRQADPMSLPAEMSGFDVVVLSDVIDKVSSPNAVLGRLGGMRGLVRTGGLLVVSSCFEWDATITPRSLWLGGYHDSISTQSSESALVDRLKEDFLCVESVQVPVMWRESRSEIRGKEYKVMVFKRISE